MSRPRKPFGAQHPGRLPSTMVKVLAAEMSDPRRLSRGKQYAKDGSVLDIIIEPGIVTCEVQGSRPTPYIASIEVTTGDGMPLRRDLSCSCTCPDDDNWDGHACKHVIGSLFTLANELLLEPELLDVWRNNSDGAGLAPDLDRDDSDVGATTVNGSDDDDDTPSRGRRRHLRLVTNDEREADEEVDDQTDDSEPSVFEDPLRVALRIPVGTRLPEIPVLERTELFAPKDRDLATALRDALNHVRVDWD